MGIGRVNFSEKGPLRRQYKFCIGNKFCMLYFTVIYSEDLASVLLGILCLLIFKVLSLGYKG